MNNTNNTDNVRTARKIDALLRKAASCRMLGLHHEAIACERAVNRLRRKAEAPKTEQVRSEPPKTGQSKKYKGHRDAGPARRLILRWTKQVWHLRRTFNIEANRWEYIACNSTWEAKDRKGGSVRYLWNEKDNTFRAVNGGKRVYSPKTVTKA